jgi:DNA modification methylase
MLGSLTTREFPHWESTDKSVLLVNGDCLDVLAKLDADSVDAVVCDPPYELGFMGKRWDSSGVAFQPETWEAVLRVLKPGGHLLAFGGTRTYHRLTCAIEDAGFDIRDCIGWIYGSGFPKSLDVSKAIDKAAGAERERGQHRKYPDGRKYAEEESGGRSNGFSGALNVDRYESLPATEAAREWSGWGTALKPAFEPVVVARKPLVGTVANNVLQFGTGGINVDACRVNPGEVIPGGGGLKGGAESRNAGWQRPSHVNGAPTAEHVNGRWPANIIHDGSEEVLGVFPETGPGGFPQSRTSQKTNGIYQAGWSKECSPGPARTDSGSAARFFYCAKADGTERGNSKHPTVKPLDLMRYLIRLVTPPGGIVLDPFLGSGTTAEAALLENVRCIGTEKDTEHGYFADAIARVQRQFERHPLLNEPTKPQQSPCLRGN